MKKSIWLLSILGVFPMAAWGHPGHELTDFVSGFSHPFTGLDHLLVMLAVGFWAGQSLTKARWQIPGVFLVFMGVGLLVGAAVSYLAVAEIAVMISLLAMALVIVFRAHIAPLIQLLLATVFALIHGFVHGQEWAYTGEGVSAVVGMLFASAVLLLSGVLLGSYRHQLHQWLRRGLVTALTLSGATLLLL